MASSITVMQTTVNRRTAGSNPASPVDNQTIQCYDCLVQSNTLWLLT